MDADCFVLLFEWKLLRLLVVWSRNIQEGETEFGEGLIL